MKLRSWGRWTVRSRLVLVTIVLATVAVAAANAVGAMLLRSSLVERVDEQLLRMSRPLGSDPPLGTMPGTRPARSASTSFVLVYRSDGTVDPERDLAAGAETPRPTFREASESADTATPYTVVAAETSWRLLAVRNPATGAVAVLGASLTDVDDTVDQLLIIDVAVLLLAVALLGLGASAVVRLGLRPLTRMERVAAAISGGELSRRVSHVDQHTESGRLGAALNMMLGRIESEVSARDASEQRLRQFVADASHELRTPLTSIRGFAELYRRGGAPAGPRLDEAMCRIESEAARMGELVEDLLLLASLDLQRPPDWRPVDLLAIAADTISDAHARTPDRLVRLADLTPGPVEIFDAATVLGDEHRLRQVATNLLNNALQHTAAGTPVTVRVGHLTPGQPAPHVIRSGPVPHPLPESLAVIEVSDDGPGVPPQHAPHVFERLYRADTSRARGHGGGSGLGLSIVASIVHAHGGWVELHTSADTGTTFRVLLPALRPNDGIAAADSTPATPAHAGLGHLKDGSQPTSR